MKRLLLKVAIGSLNEYTVMTYLKKRLNKTFSDINSMLFSDYSYPKLIVETEDNRLIEEIKKELERLGAFIIIEEKI